jgi:hypothetical protein
VELDIDVPADLDQFGRDNSHGTFVRGEGLVELGHHPADGRRLLHQMNEETGISQVQCGLHAGDASTDYHHRAQDRAALRLSMGTQGEKSLLVKGCEIVKKATFTEIKKL